MYVNRRQWLHGIAGLGLNQIALASAVDEQEPKFRWQTLTAGPRHHFFGYYGMPPWNQSGKYLVCLESSFQEHMPTADEPAAIGLVDPKTGAFSKLTETRAWNFQQGAMLHWNPLQPEREIVYNDRKDGEVVAVVLDVESGKKRELPRAVSAVSRNGKHALSLTYGRLTRLRKVVGYPGLKDPNPDSAHPDNDGIFLLDLATGQAKLVVPISEVYRRLVKNHPDLMDRHMWFNHTVFSRDDQRFLFLARAWKGEAGKQRLESAMFTANLDGTELRQVIPFQVGVSHFDWRNSKEIIATYPYQGLQTKHVLFDDGEEKRAVVGDGFFNGDGHCHFSPDGRWLVSDPVESATRSRTLLVYSLEQKKGWKIGTFALNDYLSGDLRCDLHPRWNRTGDAICFDALEPRQGTRQLHVASFEK